MSKEVFDIRAAREEIAKLRASRDELLATLKGIVEYVETTGTVDHWISKAITAIASAESHP